MLERKAQVSRRRASTSRIQELKKASSGFLAPFIPMGNNFIFAPHQVSASTAPLAAQTSACRFKAPVDSTASYTFLDETGIPPAVLRRPSKCFFMDMLPPELRLVIYEHLIVAKEPLRGPTARAGRRYGLELAILRTSHQIYEESRSLFFGKNTFHITSFPEAESEDQDQGLDVKERAVGQFDPPVPLSTWPLIRHLTIDLLYYSSKPITGPTENWKPSSPGAAAYICNLTSLLRATSNTLLTLALTAEVTEPFCPRKCLLSFFMCDRDRAFASAIANTNVNRIPVSFEFPDCYFRMDFERDVFLKKSILLLACQVMFCQSQVRIDQMLKAFEMGEMVDGPVIEKTDLGPYVGGAWRGMKGGSV